MIYIYIYIYHELHDGGWFLNHENIWVVFYDLALLPVQAPQKNDTPTPRKTTLRCPFAVAEACAFWQKAQALGTSQGGQDRPGIPEKRKTIEGLDGPPKFFNAD